MLPVALAVRQYSARVEAFRGLAAEAGLPPEVLALPARARMRPTAQCASFARCLLRQLPCRSDCCAVCTLPVLRLKQGSPALVSQCVFSDTDRQLLAPRPP